MLSLAKMGSTQHRYYLELASPNYYLDGGEPPGQWIGAGSLQLGLTGEVEAETFSKLWQGLSADGKALTQQQNYKAKDGKTRKRQPGWDMTFSAPKSVSIAWALGDGALTKRLEEAHDKAIAAAISYLEETAFQCRTGQGGSEVQKAKPVLAAFQHGTSRAQDPQLHTHVLCLNVSVGGDGKTRTLDTRELYRAKMAAGAIYRSALAATIRNELGIAIERVGRAFEISGIPEALVSHFSKRRQAIEAAAATNGWTSARRKEQLCLSTRSVKDHVARSELSTRWAAEAERHEIGRDDILKLAGKPQQQTPLQSLRAPLTMTLENLMKNESTFRERGFLAAFLDETVALGFDPRTLRATAESYIQKHEALVDVGVVDGQRHLATEESYALEKWVVKEANKGREDARFSPSTRGQALAEEAREKLRPSQRDALEHIAFEQGWLKLVSGMAGTGKTFMLGTAREIWEASGFEVLGTAIAAKAARELEAGSGITSMTIAGFLQGAKKPGRNGDRPPKPTVLVVDEAGMVGTKRLSELMAHCKERNWKLVLVGDERQLQAIEAGGGFDRLSRELGCASMNEIVRQKQEWMRDAVSDAARGDTKAVIGAYAAAKRLHVEKTKSETLAKLVLLWLKNRTEDLAKSLILAGTNVEVGDLNSRVQSARIEAGEIGDGRAARFGNERFYVGDRILGTENDYDLGLLNGDLGTIESIRRIGSKFQALIRLDREEDGKPLRISVLSGGDTSLKLGYAVTTHKAQGATVDRSFILAGGVMQDREQSYVQLSRAREDAWLVCDKDSAGEEFADLAHQMSVSRQKLLALDLEVKAKEQELAHG